jgi:hypothetical protein
MDQIRISATNGERCSNETHRFRIGNEVTDAEYFQASAGTFASELESAIIRHGVKHGARSHWNIQVRGRESERKNDWRQIQNPDTGGVMAVTAQIAYAPDTSATLFEWACNTVQMMRDIHSLADGLANLATDDQ